MNPGRPIVLAALTPEQTQQLKRYAAGLATRDERRAIRKEREAVSGRGLHALKSGRGRI